MLTRNLISFSFELAGFLSLVCLEMSYRNFPSATILQTGGFAVGAISTRSRPMPWALRKASDNFMTPSCSPVDPKITRTSRARIRPFTRNCCCRLNQAPDRRNGSAPHRRISVYRNSRYPQRRTPRHSGLVPDAIHRDEVLALIIASQREVVGKISRWQGQSREDYVSICQASLCRWIAKMRLVRRVCNCVVKHRIECRRQGLELDNPRKDRAITNLGVDHERRPLRDLKRVKFGR